MDSFHISEKKIQTQREVLIQWIKWIGTYKAGQPLYLREGSFSLSKPLAIWC